MPGSCESLLSPLKGAVGLYSLKRVSVSVTLTLSYFFNPLDKTHHRWQDYLSYLNLSSWLHDVLFIVSYLVTMITWRFIYRILFCHRGYMTFYLSYLILSPWLHGVLFIVSYFVTVITWRFIYCILFCHRYYMTFYLSYLTLSPWLHDVLFINLILSPWLHDVLFLARLGIPRGYTW